MISGKFVCPQCLQPTLAIGAGMDFPPDRSSDDITLQILACGNCGLGAVAVYEESRRGSLDCEASHHTGYRTSKQVLSGLQRAMAQCPSPRDSDCGCAAHVLLGAQDANGAWAGLGRAGIDASQSFAMLEHQDG